MRSFLFFIFFTACLKYSSQTQNLIPDSSFEYNNFIPIDYSAIGASTHWESPSRGTTDLFCKCGKKQEKISHVNVPQNAMGFQEAHSGKCYAGIFACSHGYYREYLQTTLSTTLEKGKEYELTFYISLSDYSPLAVDKLGVCFLNGKVRYEHSDVINGLRALQVPLDEVRTDTKDWHQLTVRYKAKGGESALLIGCFEIKKLWRTGNTPPQEIHTPIYKKMERDAYYYFDDISLRVYTPEIIDTAEVVENPYFDNLKKDSIETVVILPDTSVSQISFEKVLVFKNVSFNTGEAVFTSNSYSELNLLSDHMNADSRLRLEIYGHTDNVGNEKKNMELSLNRAKAVADYLIAKGVVRGNITYEGFGSSKPIDSNDTEEGRKNNRRVEFILKQR